MRIGRSAGGFVKDAQGSTAIEFALIAAPFLALILFALQLAIVFFADQVLLTFNESVSRNILTGYTQGQGLTREQFKAQLCAKLPTLFSCNRFAVDVQSATAFSSAVTSTPADLSIDGTGHITNVFAYDPGTSGSVVVVRMMYVWPVVGTILGTLSNQGVGNHLILSTAVFQNEQYGS